VNSEQHAYWNSFYTGKRSQEVPDQPSPFATWVEDRLPRGANVWEFGFGTARDALWFASRGYSIKGFDFAESAVSHARAEAVSHALDAEFSVLDLYDRDQVLRVTKAHLDHWAAPNVYGRFLLHALTDEGRHNLLDMASEVLARGGLLLLEFRTGEDAEARHLFGEDHFRQYLNPELVVAEITSRGGTVIDRLEGQGLAVYKTEDPHVARLVARWSPEDSGSRFGVVGK